MEKQRAKGGVMSNSLNNKMTRLGLTVAAMDELIQGLENTGLPEEAGIIEQAMKQLFRRAEQMRID
ncbi:MAG TPA: hypothetical protein VEF76_10435, partial [Patescibacteria group bacterium]|nr:hypothetical protein [Patescibacteria group bacterium]